jgi:predicted amidohydrolase YtcJ
MHFRRCLIFIGLLSVAVTCQHRNESADVVILGGTIYTMSDAHPAVQAVAIKGDRILFAGSAMEGRRYVTDQTKVIDLEGMTMTPGFIESHGHLMGVGYNALELDVSSVKNYEELVARVGEAVMKTKPGQWILGRGWHQDKWDHKPEKMVQGFQTHEMLSKFSPDNPVYLYHASGHAALANAKAMEIAGINPLSAEKVHKDNGQEGGEVIRDAFGNPTGIFNEDAMGLISKYIPEKTSVTDEQALELALHACAQNGLTSFHDAGVQGKTIRLLKKLKADGRLTARLYLMLQNDPNLLREWFEKGPEIDPDHLLTIRSIKLYCDGALGSRGAWLLEAYADRKDFYGMATTSMDTILKVSREALTHGFQVCTHAIGDRGNREILNIYEKAFKENPKASRDPRFRIEHAQHLHPNDIPRFAQLGVIASMQAIHMSSDRPWAIDRLGEKRIKEGAYVWQSLLKSGVRVINGTDAPVEPLNPIPCFYASVTRKTLKGEPEGGYEPDERMTRTQALKSYTLDAAYGAFEEKFKGSIEVGKLADFTVFSKDIMTIPEEEILQTEVLLTIVGGKVIYNKQ